MQEVCVGGASTADVLRLLSGGATGAILMALGEGPLRTKGLTREVPGYAPRTIYRYAWKLAELDIVGREEEPGVPSKVVHTLTDPCGCELFDLVSAFAETAMTRLPDGRIDAQAWAFLGLLGDLWESGMIEGLSRDPHSPTELARAPHGLSYHQVNRRAGLFNAAGLFEEEPPGPGRRRTYALADRTRKAMGLIAGIGRWRHRHVVAGHEEGLTAAEMKTILRASLPLLVAPEHAGKRLGLEVSADEVDDSDDVVWAEVGVDGTLRSCPDPASSGEAWVRGPIEAWIPLILDGDATQLLVGGDRRLAGEYLARLHPALWAPSSF